MNKPSSYLPFVLFSMFACGCAGSAPDYGARTAGGPDQELKLAGLLDQSEGTEPMQSSQKIVVPVCSSTVGQSETGWAIDGGNWCVVPCNDVVTEARWSVSKEGSKCFSTPGSGATKQVEVDLMWTDLALDQSSVFNGLSKAFLSDTEWHCKEYSFLIDRNTRQGFWNELPRNTIIYRFHRDGKLLTGHSLGLMKLSGSWHVNSKKQVYFNSTEVFKYAIDYGGGRFDNFKSATNKQVCRFVREAELLTRIESVSR